MRAKPDQAVDRHADQKVHGNTSVHGKSLMAKLIWEVRKEREVIDRIAEKDGDEVFKPPPGSRSEKLASHAD